MENLFDTFKKAHETYEKPADEEEPFKERVIFLPRRILFEFFDQYRCAAIFVIFHDFCVFSQRI